MKEVRCVCGTGLGFKRHDEHILHRNKVLLCDNCEKRRMAKYLIRKMAEADVKRFYSKNKKLMDKLGE